MKLKIITVLLLAGMFFALSCVSDPNSAGRNKQAGRTSAAGAEASPGIWRVVFDYNMFSGNQYLLNATITDFTEEGAKVEIKKHKGPLNYYGKEKIGIFLLDRRKKEQFLAILSRYPIRKYAGLPSSGAGYAPSRSLYVAEGSEKYYVLPMAKFPKTIPPEEDIMYFELFNFFNNLIYDAPGWEEVCTENLEDPRNNPAYGERMVNQYGKVVRLVPGTGTVTKDGRGAQIDYQGKQWWVEENFVGTYMMTEQDRSDSKGLNPVPEVSLVVSEDGTVLFTENGEQRSGCLLQTRCYLEDIPLGGFDEIGGLLVSPCYQDNYGRIRLYRKMRPHPEPQFPSLSVYLTKQ